MDPQKPAAKKRKLTDKSLPASILHSPTFSVDSQMYQDLLAMERRLDWTMTRKRTEVQDAMSRPITATRTMRIFLSHTVSGQAWQRPASSDPTASDVPNVNFETGEGIPAWQFKIEGRILEIPNQRAKDRVPPRKFSTLIKSMVVELERDPAQYPDQNVIEWKRGPGVAPLDGFTIRRRGDAPTKIRVMMYLEQHPEQLRVHPDLGNIIGVKEESRTGVVQALWNYIKVQGLQDKVDRKMIKADAALRPIFGQDSISFQQIPERINRYFMPAEPIVLHYTLNPSVPPPEKASAWDVEVRTDDLGLKTRMNHVLVGVAQDTAKELLKIDDEIALHVQSLTNSHLKRTFLASFANAPQAFIQTWLESQSRDLESILGSGPSEGATLRQDDLRRSEYFRLPWVEEAVAVQEGLRLAAKVGL
ncbi:hypothetical protein NLI96_g4515 [Meripilus lineatus]|uniref:DM2 domain-containing protein n=1 Tax=Meripilus lineatus TaxID=2056292 RepID=A0AAD5V4T5_9APHY|nr:hypothetical protein NLI96_g4515 [Physisporinus lineatus]